MVFIYFHDCLPCTFTLKATKLMNELICYMLKMLTSVLCHTLRSWSCVWIQWQNLVPSSAMHLRRELLCVWSQWRHWEAKEKLKGEIAPSAGNLTLLMFHGIMLAIFFSAETAGTEKREVRRASASISKRNTAGSKFITSGSCPLLPPFLDEINKLLTQSTAWSGLSPDR